MVRLSLAIPDSAVSDESTKLDKTRKISHIARIASIFGTHTIFVYRDGHDTDRSLMTTILRYIETPQFLRRRLFPRISELKFAGVIYPLNIPSHQVSADISSIKAGDVREGLAVTIKARQYVDVGVDRLIPISDRIRDGRTAVRFRTGYPDPHPTPIQRDQTGAYWGYIVRERQGISHLLKEWRGGVIVTTRFGKAATTTRTARYTKHDSDTLVVFGSPKRDVREIAGGRLGSSDMSQLNFFPSQCTRTVRLEEAMMGALTVLNMHAEVGS